MIFHNQIREFFIKIGVEKYQIENVSKQTLEENQTKEASFDFDAVESLSTESILKAQLEHKDLSVIGMSFFFLNGEISNEINGNQKKMGSA